MAAEGGVAFFAHIGGFLFGVICAYVVSKTHPDTDVCYIPTNCAPCDHEDHDNEPEHTHRA